MNNRARRPSPLHLVSVAAVLFLVVAGRSSAMSSATPEPPRGQETRQETESAPYHPAGEAEIILGGHLAYVKYDAGNAMVAHLIDDEAQHAQTLIVGDNTVLVDSNGNVFDKDDSPLDIEDWLISFRWTGGSPARPIEYYNPNGTDPDPCTEGDDGEYVGSMNGRYPIGSPDNARAACWLRPIVDPSDGIPFAAGGYGVPADQLVGTPPDAIKAQVKLEDGILKTYQFAGRYDGNGEHPDGPRLLRLHRAAGIRLRTFGEEPRVFASKMVLEMAPRGGSAPAPELEMVVRRFRSCEQDCTEIYRVASVSGGSVQITIGNAPSPTGYHADAKHFRHYFDLIENPGEYESRWLFQWPFPGAVGLPGDGFSNTDYLVPGAIRVLLDGNRPICPGGCVNCG